MIIGSKQIYFDELPSTNSEASRFIKEGNFAEGCVIRAGFQSAGRGHGINAWVSEKDMNLLFSIILCPDAIDASDQFYISMAVSLGLSDYVSGFCIGTKIKWPNDIYVNDDKIAGILIENSLIGGFLQNSIAGIGININQVDFQMSVPNPVSLRIKTGRHYDLNKCFDEILTILDKRYRELLYGNREGMRAEYTSLLYRFNEWHSYKSCEGVCTGRVKGVTDEGRLIIEDHEGRMAEYGFKEIEF
jgi:BirA family transcriptional regulator, biotin operon repressor / biotin---[acetyl-CoA-carboxylase] ligase